MRRLPVLHRDIVANIVTQGLVVVAGFVAVPLYIHYLGIEAYGVVGLFALLQSMLFLLDLGMSPTLMREVSRFTGGDRSIVAIRDLLRSVEIAGAIIAAMIAILVWAGAGWLAHHWLKAGSVPIPVIERALAAAGLIVAFRFMESIFRSAVLGLHRQQSYNAISLIAALLRSGGAVLVLATLSNTLDAFFLWQALISGLTVIALAILTYRTLPTGERSGRFSLVELLAIWRFAFGMLNITLLSLLLTQLDKIMLSRLLPLRDYAHYILAGTAAAALEMFAAPIFQALTPRLSQMHASGDEAPFVRLYHQAAQLISVLIGAAAAVVIVFADTLLLAWTHDGELAVTAAPLLRLLATGYLLNIVMWVPYQAQLAYRWTSLTIKVNLVAVLLMTPLLLWVVPRYGPIGAAAAWAGLNAMYLLVNAHLMHRRILHSEKWQWYGEDVILPVASAFMATLLLRWLVRDQLDGMIFRYGIIVAATTISLLASLIAASSSRRWLSKLVREKYVTAGQRGS